MRRKNRCRVKPGIKALSACSLMLLLFGMFPAYGGTMLDQNSDAAVASGVQEGEIVEVEEQTLVIKSRNTGKILRIPMPLNSHKNANDFKVGEHIEPVVSPEGITTSVVHLEGQLRR